MRAVSMLRKAALVCLLAAALIGCGDSTENEEATVLPENSPAAADAAAAASPEAGPTAAATPTSPPAADAAPSASPSPDAAAQTAAEEVPVEPTPAPPTQTQSIIFYDLTKLESTCPGYQELTGFRQTVSQVKITCTGPGVETVYFVDLDNFVVTGIRVPLLDPEIP